MAKFNTGTARARLSHPVTTTGSATTFEGGPAYTRDTRSDLVMLAVTNMVGEDTFYEKGGTRDDRYTGLVRACAVADPAWTTAFLRWLRGEANMRSASLVGAAEFVKGRLEAMASGDVVPDVRAENANGGGWNRKAVDAVLQRADEPGEFLAYWTGRYGRKIPKPVKRGLADAVQRLYKERSLLKWDTGSHGWRFADVLELAHPEAVAPWQSDLFKHAIDRRHGRGDTVPDGLRILRANASMRAHPEDVASWLSPRVLNDSGMTWEDVLSAMGGKVDKAKLWEALIPSMGIMALVRNLRNFDEAGVSEKAAAAVCARLADPEEIARSRQFPFRFLSAYRAAPSLRWGHALDQALKLSTANIPVLPGRTLVLADTSGSMRSTVSAKSQIRHVDVAALFAVALAARGSKVDLVGFADGGFRHTLVPGGSVLKQTEAFCARIGEVGNGTRTAEALQETYDGHDRVMVFSDMQAFGNYSLCPVAVTDAVPAHVPLFGFNTTGYAPTSIDSGRPNRYEVGGFSDKLFTMVALLSSGRDARWPWDL